MRAFIWATTAIFGLSLVINALAWQFGTTAVAEGHDEASTLLFIVWGASLVVYVIDRWGGDG